MARSAALAASLGALLIAASFAAPAEEIPKNGGTLNYVIPADAPPSFNAHRETTFATIPSAAPFSCVLTLVDPNTPSLPPAAAPTPSPTLPPPPLVATPSHFH